MSNPLLVTKLNAPPLRPNHVSRPQLSIRLSAEFLHASSFQRKLTLVCAPAGYGKTSLVTEWLHGLDTRVAWLSLDEHDNDPVRFVLYLIAALQQVAPDVGTTSQSLLQSPRPPPSDVILTSVLNDIAALAYPIILVLDDYHLLQSPAVHQHLSFLVDNQPPQLHQVILTREDPPLPIHRFRASGQLLEIRQDDLRFTVEEAGFFLHELMAIDISSREVAALVRRTEGWVAGLHLAALSMRAHPDLREFVRSFTGSNRFILDYLFEEVFQRQSPEIQHFLLNTSVLTRFCASLCDAVLGDKGKRTAGAITAHQPLSPPPHPLSSQSILEYLERSNLFIIPLDHERTWYRYHHLFAELLQHQLRLLGEPSEDSLHQRASQWYQTHGFIADAIHHAVAASDWDRAVGLILETSTDSLKRGEFITLGNWCARLPSQTIRANPLLSLSFAWALMLASRFEQAGVILQRLEQSVGGQPALMGEVATAQAFMAQSLGEMRQMVEFSHKALDLLPEDSLNSRGLVALNLGIAYWHVGHLGAAQQALEQALQANHQSGNTYGEMMAHLFLARLSAVRGQLHQAAKEFEAIAYRADEITVFPLVYLDLCTLHYEWDQLQAAARYLEKGMESSRRSGNLEFQIAAWLLQARLCFAQGDPSGAIHALEQATHIEQTSLIPLRTHSRQADLQLQVALWRGDLEAALRLELHLVPDADSHPFYRFLGLTAARLLIARGRRAEAADYLAQAAQTALDNDWGYGLIAARVLQALAVEGGESAMGFLGEALRLGAPQGFTRTFAEAGEDLVPLLQEAARCGLEPEHVGRILAIFQSGPSTPPVSPELVEPLSEREIEVLCLVAAGLSNRQIAAKLILSLGTVKSHIHNIYGKLDVRNRAQAVDRARDLNLLKFRLI